MSGTVCGTPDAALYQHGRMANNALTLIYTFSLPNTGISISLNPGDEHIGSGFSVKLQGNAVIQELDIFKAAEQIAALILGSGIAVTKGEVKIELDTFQVKTRRSDRNRDLPGATGGE